MTKKSIIWGLETPMTAPAILNLQKRGLITICAWFGDKRNSEHVTHHCYDFQGRTKATEATTYKSILNSTYNTVYAYAYPTFLEMTSRSYQDDIKSFHDLADIFNTQFNYLESLINNLGIDFILFHNIPHEGPDYILYTIAKAMGISTLILTQSPFPERFFSMRSIDDLGAFQASPLDQDYITEKIEKKFEKEYFYMPKKISGVSIFKQQIMRLFWLAKILLATTSLLGISKSRRYFYRYFYYLDYKKYKAKISNNKIDLSKKFVYFPLHLQPEMTTSALGGIYCDQLLAIERLHDMLPPDWYIYIKENPKQTYTHRGNDFFKRLHRIKNTQYITNADTYTLTKHSQFVATISGSAGWEAICGGKNVLLFGHAWYKNLPGVFKYTTELQLADILAYQIEHAQLSTEFQKLMHRSSQGIIDPAYIVLSPTFNTIQNNKNLEAAIAAMI
jgi:hypothetical protein